MLKNGYGFVRVLFLKDEQRFNYLAYPRFSSLISFDGDSANPKLKSVSWLMKIVDDLYDNRFAIESQQSKFDEYDLNSRIDFTTSLTIFPIFVLRHLGNSMGLKSLADQLCWDLLLTVHVNREDYLEVEIFARFLQEFYDQEDLLFFLNLRALLSKSFKINFKSRWNSLSASPLVASNEDDRSRKWKWLSYRQCLYVSQLVFGGEGGEDSARHQEFLDTLGPILVGQKTPASPGRPAADTRRMNLDEFLHLSVLFFHRSVKGSRARLFPSIPGQTAPAESIPQSPYEGIFDLNKIPPPPPPEVVARRQAAAAAASPVPDRRRRSGGGSASPRSPSRTAAAAGSPAADRWTHPPRLPADSPLRSPPRRLQQDIDHENARYGHRAGPKDSGHHAPFDDADTLTGSQSTVENNPLMNF